MAATGPEATQRSCALAAAMLISSVDAANNSFSESGTLSIAPRSTANFSLNFGMFGAWPWPQSHTCIAGLWPVFAEAGAADGDIRKLNHTGTHPVHTDLAIMNAIDFHESIGISRKEARLRYLQNYWTNRVRPTPNIVLNTPSDPRRSCAIANVGVGGLEPRDLARTLLEKYRIWTVAIDTANVRGVRITPHLFTTTAELDALVGALTELAGPGAA